MIHAMIGELIEQNNDYIILNNSNILYRIEVASNFTKTDTIYIYEVINDLSRTLYGFNSIEQKELFAALISINGIGPKTCLKVIGHDDCEKIIAAINEGNFSYLMDIKALNDKKISDIFIKFKNKIKSHDEIKIIKSLKKLGYKDNDIKKFKYSEIDKYAMFEEKIIIAINQMNE